MLAVPMWTDAMDLVQNLASGIWPNLKVFLLSPPLRPLLLSSPPFGGVGGLGAPPFVFLCFSFPFFLPPRGHAVFEVVRLALRPTVGNHIGSSVKLNLI